MKACGPESTQSCTQAFVTSHSNGKMGGSDKDLLETYGLYNIGYTGMYNKKHCVKQVEAKTDTAVGECSCTL